MAEVVLDGIATDGGLHCETTALGVLLGHAGAELSEPLLFGLAGGLSFVYWDSKRQDVPFLGGRVKPFVLTQQLSARLGLDLRVRETSSPRVAWGHVSDALEHGSPVGLQLDSHDLEYFGSRVHFAGHVVAMYGYDEERAYLVDTAQQGGRVTTSLESLARARAAGGPMSARHRSFTLEVPPASRPTPERLAAAIVPAVVDCAAAFLDPPIANLGHRGIETAARRVPTWFERVEEPARDLPLIASLMERAGTGGALFRNLYRDFLTEALDVLAGGLDADRLGLVARGRDLVAEAAVLWTEVATLVEQAGTEHDPRALGRAGRVLTDIAALETEAMTALRSLG